MELAKIKQEYDKISDALASVKATGYGVVMPAAGEMQLEKPGGRQRPSVPVDSHKPRGSAPRVVD